MINWLKYKKYWKSRLAKLKGTPQSIAVGAACGIAISFTPFVGAHMMLAMIMAWVLRGNIMAALVGTTVGNPWTFPFIWVSIFYTGRKILGSDYTEAANIDFAEVFAKAVKALINLDFDLFFNDIWPIVFPMMVGCIPFCIVVWTAAYYVIKMMIKPK